jgi:hypothetical protein
MSIRAVAEKSIERFNHVIVMYGVLNAYNQLEKAGKPPTQLGLPKRNPMPGGEDPVW